ncbi:MAG: CHC2 zinc finger domain-containing protein [Desulfobulbus sp.]|nr:CHC2 zinc finger domain-containing protein [Desulfobulbus sp.]
MPRIPEAELERLKKEVSLLRLIEGQGYEMEKRGKDWALRCVFHEEATASLIVSPATHAIIGFLVAMAAWHGGAFSDNVLPLFAQGRLTS